MQFTISNGVMLHYQRIGTPRSVPPLVFINSLGTDFRIWRDVVVQLAGEHDILLYDKRGHGLSDLGAPPYRLEDHVGDLAGLVDQLRWHGAIVCGLSLGGQVALGLVAERPDLVGALVLADTAPKIGDRAFWNQRIAAIEAGGVEAVADAVLGRWFAPGFVADHALEFAGYANMLRRQPPKGYAGSCAVVRDTDLTAAARKTGVPTLCLVGANDLSTPPDLVAAMAALIPGAQYKIIADAGHLTPVEQPGRVVDALRAFIATLERKAPPHGTH